MTQDNQSAVSAWAQRVFGPRPIWMNALMLFCAYMTFFYMPWDLFVKPVADDQEVWFGIMLTGWAAKATEPLHWLIYGAGAWGFWKMRPWMWPWATLYVVQIAIGMLVWQLIDERGKGLLPGLLSSVPFVILAIALWRAKGRFNNSSADPTPSPEQPEAE